MSVNINIQELSKRYLCWECIDEWYLSDEIHAAGHVAKCSYCKVTAPAISIEGLANRIEIVFEQHFYRTSSYPDYWEARMSNDPDSNYCWERPGVEIVDAIEGTARIPIAAAKDVQSILENRHSSFESAKMNEETEFAADSYYAEKPNNGLAWQEDWQEFEKSLKTQARFFSRKAADLLGAVFGDIDKLLTSDSRPLVIDAGPGSDINELYRARVFQSDIALEEALCSPDTQLGSPPFMQARAGRMNARGISVFYGATHMQVAIAEVRPPVGSKVAVGKFLITRSLKLLDLTSLENVFAQGSVFDPSLAERLERAEFLRSLGKRMTKPVMPGDEDLDYLATQACADFLAAENNPLLDGIIFPSAQVKMGRNVVLFNKAAKIEWMEMPVGTEIAANMGRLTSDGWVVDYSVVETTPAVTPQTNETITLIEPFDGYEPELTTLRVDPNSVVVHHVDWVDYQCTAYPVDRRRYQASKGEESTFTGRDILDDDIAL